MMLYIVGSLDSPQNAMHSPIVLYTKLVSRGQTLFRQGVIACSISESGRLYYKR